MRIKKTSSFPVFHPVTENLIGYKPRELVHVDGDWHRGVQAHIVRPNTRGTFDILVQRRSNIVDIGAYKYDQSLATQMIDRDNLTISASLRRGLEDELGIVDYTATELPLTLRIVKTYEEHAGTLNRELISLYIVQVPDDKKILRKSPKIKELVWMEWYDFIRFFNTNPEQFTKTSQFYCSDELLLPYIESASLSVIYHNPLPAPPSDAILQVNRWMQPRQTFRGNLSTILTKSGELKL